MRWPLVGLTAALLGVSGFYAVVRRPTRRNRIVFAVAALVSIGASLRPFII